jgi:hypothetical protein
MNILSVKLLGAVAVAGLVAAGGTAFTTSTDLATGPSNNVAANRFLGGSVSQTITGGGGTLEDLTYNRAGTPNQNKLASITLVFADALVNSDVTLDATYGTVLNNQAGVACTSSDEITYTCNVADQSIADLTSITVHVLDGS